MPNWTQIVVKCPTPNAEAVAQLLLDAGGAGVQTDDTSLIFDESEDATFAPRETAILTSYFAPELDSQTLQTELETVFARGEIPATLAVSPLPDEDWANQWRENFPPLHIGKFLIAPPWENVESHALVIRLDPGLAFGTGQHPTTRMCLELLGEHLDGRTGGQLSLRVLDVGCGSGILAIAAAKLGAHVVASDMDRFCIDATRENAQVNDVENQIEIVEAAGADWTDAQFPVVVANLMSDLLIRLAPDLSNRVLDNGTLIVSGISSPRADDVEAAMHNVGFKTQHKREQDGDTRGDYTERWTAFVFARI